MEHKSEILLTDKRDVVVAFRLTAREAAHIETAAASLRKPRTRGDYARAVALYASRQRVPEPAKPVRFPPRRLPALDTRLLSKLLAEVGQLASHVGDLSRAANTEGSSLTTTALSAISKEVVRISGQVTSALKGGRADEVTP